jgi:hypothetical protein
MHAGAQSILLPLGIDTCVLRTVLLSRHSARYCLVKAVDAQYVERIDQTVMGGA